MKKYWSLLLAAAALLPGCHSDTQRGVTITGQISGLDPGDLVSCVRQQVNPDSSAAERVTIPVDDKGGFRLFIPVKAGQGDWYQLWVGPTPEPARTATLYLDSGEVNISGGQDLASAAYSGNQDMQEYSVFQTGLNKAGAGKQGAEATNSQTAFMTQWIGSHPLSSMGTAALDFYQRNGFLHPDTVIAYFSKRGPASLNNQPARRLQKWLRETADIVPGKAAPDITIPDTSGKKISIRDFRGKYVLVDFWASWCVPCRAENPNVLKVYNSYKNKNFTVLGVSMDGKDARSAWLGAIHKDGLLWTQVSDLDDFNGAPAKLYHIASIPSNFLVDPKGIIVARNLRGEALDKKLAELLSR